jgi:integrase
LALRRISQFWHLGTMQIPEFVFTNERRSVLDKDNWRRRIFYKALEKAELRRIRINDLRHTYATLRISKGDNIADVSKQLGHHSVKLTLDIYYYWIPGKRKSEVDELDDPSFLHPIRTQPPQKTKKRLPKFANPLILLVAGAGFEPATFGL